MKDCCNRCCECDENISCMPDDEEFSCACCTGCSISGLLDDILKGYVAKADKKPPNPWYKD